MNISLKAKISELENEVRYQSERLESCKEQLAEKQKEIDRLDRAYADSTHRLVSYIQFYAEQLRFMRQQLILLTVEASKITPDILEKVSMPALIDFSSEGVMAKDPFTRDFERFNK